MAEEKKIATGYIGNALRSSAADHTTTFADEVFDTERQQYQNEVNADLETKIAEEKAAIMDTDRIADGAVTNEKLSEEINKKLDTFAYDSKSEYLYVIKDNKDNIICWIDEKGKVDWNDGIPKPIQNKLNELKKEISNNSNNILSSEEEIQALDNRLEEINASIAKKADGVYDENNENLKTVVDAEDNLLNSVENDGTCYYPKLSVDKLLLAGSILDSKFLSSCKCDKNPESMLSIKDSKDNLMFTISKEGKIYPVDNNIRQALGLINKSLDTINSDIDALNKITSDSTNEINEINHKISSLNSDINPIISAVVPNIGSTTMCVDKNIIYIGTNTAQIYKYDISVESNPILLGFSDKMASGYLVRSIVTKDDYIYVITRGNGSGMDNDTLFPLFLSSFELGLTDMNEDHDSFDIYDSTGNSYINETGEPCPSRWAHSAKMFKGTGNSYAQLIKVQEIGEEFYISLWLKTDNEQSGSIHLPIVFNNNAAVVSIVITVENKIGIRVNDSEYISNYIIDNKWKSIKVSFKNNTIKLSVRNKECDAIWNDILQQESVLVNANQIGIGINSNSDNIMVYIDEYCFDTKDLDLTTNINGCLSILKKDDLSIVNEYKLNMRGLCSFIDGEYLYVGMIGGLNIYDIAAGSKVKLIGFNRQTSNSINYPSSDSANYKFRVPFIELQGMHMYSNNNKKYIAAGNDVRGLCIYDITDVTNPILYKEVRDVPSVNGTDIDGNVNGYPQYVEWGVYCEYPYIYTTVAGLHWFRNGKVTLVNTEDLVYGLKIRDISDINAISSHLVKMNVNDYPSYFTSDGDSRPVYMCVIKDKIIMGNGDKGITVFEKNGMDSVLVKAIRMIYDTRICDVKSTHDGRVFVADYPNTVQKEKNIYIIKGIY